MTKKRRNLSAGPAWARDGGPMSGPDTRTVILEDPETLAEPGQFIVTVSIELGGVDEDQVRDKVLGKLKGLHVGYIDVEEL